MDGWTVVSRVADFVTLAAAALAFAGALAFWLSRPRVKIEVYSTQPSEARVLVSHYKGSATLFDLGQWLNVTDPAGGHGGDGQVTRTLYPGQSWHFVIYDPGIVQMGEGPRLTRISATPTSTVMLALRWQRPVLRWTSTSWCVVLWTPEGRAAGRSPKGLRGRAAAAAFRASNEAGS